MKGTQAALAIPVPQPRDLADATREGADRAGTRTAAPATTPFFDALVQEHHQKIYSLIYRQLGDHEEACDLTQDVFVRAYQAFEHFRGEASVYTWLYRIAINLSLNRAKQLRRRSRWEQASIDEPLQINGEQLQREFADWSRSPEKLAEDSELQRLIHHSIGSLPPDYRAVVLLRDVQGLSYAEVAEATGSSLEAVKSRLFRARTQLQSVLQPYLTDFLS